MIPPFATAGRSVRGVTDDVRYAPYLDGPPELLPVCC